MRNEYDPSEEDIVQFEILPNFCGPKNSPLIYAHPGDAGMDLYAAEETVLLPGDRAAVGTGLRLAIPRGFEGQVRPRSGNALKLGLTVLNTPGTIDSGYRGEVKVILYNSNPALPNDFTFFNETAAPENANANNAQLISWRKKTAIRIKPGDKIAQIVFALVGDGTGDGLATQEVFSLDRETARGEAGFGSTGR